jgi:hypothetical protein
MLTAKIGAALHRCSAIGAGLQHSYTIEHATIAIGVCVQHLDHEPSIRMSVTDVAPAHRSPSTASNFLVSSAAHINAEI